VGPPLRRRSIFHPWSPRARLEGPWFHQSPPSAAEKVRLARVPPVQGLLFNPRPDALSAPPARRTFLGPFVWRRPRKAAAVPANGDDAYEDGAVDPTLNLMDVCVMLKEE